MSSPSWLATLPDRIDLAGLLPLLSDATPAEAALLRLRPGDPHANALAAAYEDLGAPAREQHFHYFTRSIFPLDTFLAEHLTYALIADGEVLAHTSIDPAPAQPHDAHPAQADATAPAALLGFTSVLPHAAGRGWNALLKLALFATLADAGIATAHFRRDEANLPSRRGVERVGAVLRDGQRDARPYPDGRLSVSVFHDRPLLPMDWVFAASNDFAARVGTTGEVYQLVQAALHSDLEWCQLQHASAPGTFLAFDRAGQGRWRVSASPQLQPQVATALEVATPGGAALGQALAAPQALRAVLAVV